MRKYFVTGLFILLPLVVTIYLLVVGFSIVDGILGNWIAQILGRSLPGAGLVLTFALIMATGLIATNVLGRKLLSLGDRMFLRIPLVRTIYQSVKQIMDAFSSSSNKAAFKQVVLVEYPRAGIYSLAFVTSEDKGEIQFRTKEDCINIFIPTTPNPTSGFFLIIPASDCIPLDMSVEDGFKLIISGGVITPTWEKKGNQITP